MTCRHRITRSPRRGVILKRLNRDPDARPEIILVRLDNPRPGAADDQRTVGGPRHFRVCDNDAPAIRKIDGSPTQQLLPEGLVQFVAQAHIHSHPGTHFPIILHVHGPRRIAQVSVIRDAQRSAADLPQQVVCDGVIAIGVGPDGAIINAEEPVKIGGPIRIYQVAVLETVVVDFAS